MSALQVERVGAINVVRDDRVPGGTKTRVLPSILEPGREYVYASSAYGYAQVALAYAARSVGARATIFTAQRKQPHPRTIEAHTAGARIMQVPHGYLSNVTAKARAYANDAGAILLPLGFDGAAFRAALTALARMLPLDAAPSEVWTVAGSGTLTRALQAAWPSAAFHAVMIGATPDIGRARLWIAPEKFEINAKQPPPFPSCGNYDAKAWRFIRHAAAPGALFWNVAA